jgi:SAM-dependent methyltransferase
MVDPLLDSVDGVHAPSHDMDVLTMKKPLYFGPNSKKGVAHPAPFSTAVLNAIPLLMDSSHVKVLDPFAGIGRIHELPSLVSWEMETVGVELEPEWATIHPDTLVGDIMKMPFDCDEFDAVVTSPCYGNRMADSHKAKDGSFRRSYTHDLGRQLGSNNSGAMQWGQKYREFHVNSWDRVAHVLKPGGHFILNISDHIRDGKRIHVASWHTQVLLKMGFELEGAASILTPRMRVGKNRERVGSEMLLKFLFA